MLANPWVALGAVMALVASHGAVYFYGGRNKENSILADELRLERQAEKFELVVAEQINSIKVVNTTIYQKATHEVIEKPVYRDCRHTVDGLRLVNDALTNTKPASSVELPGTDAP